MNVHIHSQVSGGAYARLLSGSLIFLRALSPTEEEIKKLTVKIACRFHRFARANEGLRGRFPRRKRTTLGKMLCDIHPITDSDRHYRQTASVFDIARAHKRKPTRHGLQSPRIKSYRSGRLRRVRTEFEIHGVSPIVEG